MTEKRPAPISRYDETKKIEGISYDHMHMIIESINHSFVDDVCLLKAYGHKKQTECACGNTVIRF